MPDAYTPARIMRAPVDNSELRTLVVAQARHVASAITWPKGIPDQVARSLCDYCEQRIPYVIDGALQSIRRPAALVVGQMSGDCKSTAIFIAGMAAAAGRASVVRFVQYRDGPRWYSHVYAVVDGVACDPLQGYAQESDYLRNEDATVSI